MKDSFVIYTKYEEQVNMLSNEQAGVLLRALMRHQSGAELPQMDDVTTMAFSFIKQSIEAENQKYEGVCQTNKANGRLGGRPPKSLINKGDKPKKPSGFQGVDKKPSGFENNQAVLKEPSGFSREKERPTKEIPDKEKGTQKEISPKETYTQEKENYIPLCISPNGGKKKDFAEEFFTLYPRYAKDRAKMRVDVDYKRLIEEFGKSKYLRSLYTVKQINEEYPLIIAGDYRDQEKQDPFAGLNARVARERWYAERKAKAENEAEKILKRFLQDEEFKRIHRRLNAMQCELAKAEVGAQAGDTKAHNQLIKLTQEQERLKLQYRGIIERNGMTEEDLLPKWHCKKCEDTGFLQDGRACDCYEGE